MIERQMAEVVTSDEEIYQTYTRLLTIPGIGPVNAINTIANTQNFTAFETARQYAKYVGVAPSEHSSGTSVRWRGRPSLHADLQAKADLSMAALRAVEFSFEMSQCYERKLGNRKDDKDVQRKALNAIKFKLIRQMFSVARQHKNFAVMQRGQAQAETHNT